MMTGFLRVLASGMMLFLALTTTTLVQRAGASTSQTSSTSERSSTEAPATSPSSTDAPATSPSSTDAPATSTSSTDAPATGSTTDTTATDPVPTDDDTGEACSAEASACLADATCDNCYYGGTNSAEADECRKFSEFTTDSEGCEFRLDEACCLDNLSEFECLDNEAFVGFSTCYLDSLGCILDEITCDGEDSTTEFDGAASNLGPVSTALAFSTAFTALLPFLWG